MTGLDSLADGRYRAVVDSIEDGLATVFFERDSEEVGNAVIESSALPTEAQHADAILEVTVEEGDILKATYDAEKTKRRKESVQDRFDRLSERPPSEEDT